MGLGPSFDEFNSVNYCYLMSSVVERNLAPVSVKPWHPVAFNVNWRRIVSNTNVISWHVVSIRVIKRQFASASVALRHLVSSSVLNTRVACKHMVCLSRSNYVSFKLPELQQLCIAPVVPSARRVMLTSASLLTSRTKCRWTLGRLEFYHACGFSAS